MHGLIDLMFMLARYAFAKSRIRKNGMPNDAGAVDATPTRQIYHLSYIDSDGQIRTDSYDMPSDASDAEMNALTAAVGAVTTASLYQIGITKWFAVGVAARGNADNVPNDSVHDNLVILMKNAANGSFDFFIPANLETATMYEGTTQPDTANPLLEAVADALIAIHGGYTPYSYRFTERRKKNRSVKP